MTYLLPSTYLGSISYYQLLVQNPSSIIERHEYYVKQTCRSRCYIYGANGVLKLVIPIKSTGNQTAMKDVIIANDTNWQVIHWRSICSAYRSSPFFEFFEDDIAPFYNKPYEKLMDFNHDIQEKILELLNLRPDIGFTKEYHAKPTGVLDVRDGFKKLQQIQAKSSVPTYIQVFDTNKGFIPNLSIIDLLFNLGPGSLDVLQKTD
jgi:hypothetical protein